MRIAAAVFAAALAVLPSSSRAQERSAASPAPVPKADAGPAAPPKAEAAPRAGAPQQQGTAAAKPPAAANELARALLTNEQWGKVLDSYASSLAGQISQALDSKGEKVPENLRGDLRAELEKTLPYQQTVQAQAEALAKAMTPDELRRTAAFYGSPLGRKALDKLPEAQSEAAQELQGRLATAVPEIVTRLAPKAMAGGSARDGAAGPSSGTGSSGGAPGPSGSTDPGPGAGGTAGGGSAR